ncbi:hypothetical protein [Methylobacterium sp. Leaf118]|uniref:hypothetical protein n=1 Tax=Methylobacterium sp. Leaf118 TaxID=2876562 RepID=UPI001E62EF5C|nr:hypothetical protein [Methylobacterium sp. Leaf118]
MRAFHPILAATLVVLASGGRLAAADRTVTVRRDAYLCDSWAAWHEYGLASLTARGARMSKACPLRLAPGTRVRLVDDEAWEGAAEIRYRGKTWFVDSERLGSR